MRNTPAQDPRETIGNFYCRLHHQTRSTSLPLPSSSLLLPVFGKLCRRLSGFVMLSVRKSGMCAPPFGSRKTPALFSIVTFER